MFDRHQKRTVEITHVRYFTSFFVVSMKIRPPHYCDTYAIIDKYILVFEAKILAKTYSEIYNQISKATLIFISLSTTLATK